MTTTDENKIEAVMNCRSGAGLDTLGGYPADWSVVGDLVIEAATIDGGNEPELSVFTRREVVYCYDSALGYSEKGEDFEGVLMELAFDMHDARQDRWVCRCDCGTEMVVCGECLRTGRITSCGCAYEEEAIQ